MAHVLKPILRAKIVPLDGRRPGVRRSGGPPGPPLPRYLTQDELARFKRAVVAAGSARDFALFGTMYRFGLRAIEVTYLQLEDVDLVHGRIRIRRAKNGQTKEYPLPRDLYAPIRKYLRKRTERGPFFFTGRTSNNQRGLTELSVRKLFKYYPRVAGLPASVASHSLRHSIAVHALQEGFGLEYIADLLGHSSVKSTAIYAKITTPAREAMMRRLDVSRHILAWL